MTYSLLAYKFEDADIVVVWENDVEKFKLQSTSDPHNLLSDAVDQIKMTAQSGFTEHISPIDQSIREILTRISWGKQP